MSFRSHVAAIAAPLRRRTTRAILAHRVRARHPTLNADVTSSGTMAMRDSTRSRSGHNVSVGPFVEILVQRRSSRSNVPGRLILDDECHIGFGTDVRAAGGTVRIGARTGVAQNCVLIAANHVVRSGEHFRARWDEERCGIDIGCDVWVGAGSVVLPGCVIGDGAVIAAGSVVRGTVPAGELWGGVPARKIRSLDT